MDDAAVGEADCASKRFVSAEVVRVEALTRIGRA